MNMPFERRQVFRLINSSLNTSEDTRPAHLVQQTNQTAHFKVLKRKTPVVSFSQSMLVPH